MSTFEKAYSVLKSAMLMDQRYDNLNAKTDRIASDLSALAGSHADLAERVARVEGFLQGANASRANPRIER